jgi:prepilin-type processing-associated H-X9-DG protein
VVIAIIGVLVSLLLPAVQKVREAANKMSCQNNLKQIGLALNNYHSSNGCFPPGSLTIGPSGNQVSHGWIARILPYIEQDNLHRLIDFTNHTWTDYDGSPPSGVNGAKITLLRCPSAPSKRGESTRAMTDYSATNLANQTGVDLSNEFSDINHQYNNAGVLLNVSAASPSGDTTGNRVADIYDGTSNTIMVAECAGRNLHWINGQLDAGTVTGRDPPGGAWANPGNHIIPWGFDPRTLTIGGQPTPPCAVNCINYQEVYAFHPGGANVVLADGSVHFLKATTDIVTLRYLISIRDGHNVTADW